jgi:hypothetical protein
VWAKWDGDVEDKLARPEAGYPYSLHHERHFDPVGSRAEDTWWNHDDPEVRWTQMLRCYSPADFALLVDGTGLTIDRLLSSNHQIALRDVLANSAASPQQRRRRPSMMMGLMTLGISRSSPRVRRCRPSSNRLGHGQHSAVDMRVPRHGGVEVGTAGLRAAR